MVGLGEVKAGSGEELVLTCLGLGSCVCVALYDPASGVGGMAHIVLPDSTASASGAGNPKFADVAVPMLLGEVKKLGAKQERLVTKIAGGAHMAQLRGPGPSSLNIGERNISATKTLLKTHGLRWSGEDTGGGSGRTVRLWVSTGKVTVSTAGGTPNDL